MSGCAILLVGDVREKLAELADNSVQCAVTSPPYWGLRDYGTATWKGGDAAHAHDRIIARGGRGGSGSPGKQTVGAFPSDLPAAQCSCGAIRVDGQLGLEATPDLYVEHMVEVFREVRRVLRPDGTLWLNLGDSYARDPAKGGSGPNGKHDLLPDYGNARKIMSESRGSSDGVVGRGDRAPVRVGGSGIKQKDLIGIPWLLAFALRADGWYLRSEIIWHKPNPMPESVTDRPTKAHETIFLLTKSARYFYDADAIAEAVAQSSTDRWAQDVDSQEGSHRANGGTKTNGTMKAVGGPRAVKARDNFARATKEADMPGQSVRQHREKRPPTFAGETRNKRSVWTITPQPFRGAHFATFPEKLVEPCILAGSSPDSLVLDPFAGSCTTAIVALRHGRNFVGVELSPAYAEIARKRVADSGAGGLLV